MADSKKDEGRDDDDLPFDYNDSKKEEAGHDDDGDHLFDYTDSKKEEGHDDDDRRFDYMLQVLAKVADAILRKNYPEVYAGAGEERSLQRPQDCSHGFAKKKPRSFPEKRFINKKRRVSPLASASTSVVEKLMKSTSSSREKEKLQESVSTSTSTTDSDDDPCWNTQLLRRWGVSESRSHRLNSNSGEGTSTDQRLQRDLAAGANRAAGHNLHSHCATAGRKDVEGSAPRNGRRRSDADREEDGTQLGQVRAPEPAAAPPWPGNESVRACVPEGEGKDHWCRPASGGAGLLRGAVRDEVQVQGVSEGNCVQLRVDALPHIIREEAPHRGRDPPPPGLPVAAATTQLLLRPSTP